MTNSEEGDEYVAGEFAGCEEPEINLERMERYGREAQAGRSNALAKAPGPQGVGSQGT